MARPSKSAGRILWPSGPWGGEQLCRPAARKPEPECQTRWLRLPGPLAAAGATQAFSRASRSYPVQAHGGPLDAPAVSTSCRLKPHGQLVAPAVSYPVLAQGPLVTPAVSTRCWCTLPPHRQLVAQASRQYQLLALASQAGPGTCDFDLEISLDTV